MAAVLPSRIYFSGGWEFKLFKVNGDVRHPVREGARARAIHRYLDTERRGCCALGKNMRVKGGRLSYFGRGIGGRSRIQYNFLYNF